MKGTRVVVYNSDVARNLPFPFLQLPLTTTFTTVTNHHPISRIWRNGMTPAKQFLGRDRPPCRSGYLRRSSLVCVVYILVLYTYIHTWMCCRKGDILSVPRTGVRCHVSMYIILYARDPAVTIGSDFPVVPSVRLL